MEKKSIEENSNTIKDLYHNIYICVYYLQAILIYCDLESLYIYIYKNLFNLDWLHYYSYYYHNVAL